MQIKHLSRLSCSAAHRIRSKAKGSTLTTTRYHQWLCSTSSWPAASSPSDSASRRCPVGELAFGACSQPATSARVEQALRHGGSEGAMACSSSTLGWRWVSRATDGSLVTGDELHTDTAASIAERDDIEVGLNRRVATRPAASPAS